MLAMTELTNINTRLIKNNQYKESDMRTMQKISSLSNFNDYDYYLMACALCNYDIPEKKDLIDLRMSLFQKVKNTDITTFKHKESDYQISKVSLKTKCKNTGNINKYGLYEYEINSKNTSLIQDLWSYKDKDCLKYVDSKTFDDKIIISIRKEQLDNFMAMLDTLIIGYDKDDMYNNITFTNSSSNKLVDISKLSLPFTPYDYQLEDANKIIKMKRALLGHEMGCFIGDTNVILADNSIVKIKDLVNKDSFLVYSYDIKTNKFVIKNAIATKTRENAEIVKVKYCVNSITIKEIYCTPDHKFLVYGDTLTWIEAKDLIANMMIVSKDTSIKIISVETIENKQDVYCLSVEDTHNFIINDGLVVHNCGKTFISILIGESIKMPKLVICPESLRLNWKKEILAVNPNADVHVLLSSETPHFGKDWTIVGYLTATKYILNLKQFDCIFIDEVQYCKSVNNWGKPASKRAASIIDLANNATYCYLLSGTPLPSHNKDLFNILKMLKCPDFDFNTQWAFRNFANKFCDPKDNGFGMDYSGNSNSEVLHNTLKPLMIRRLKKDVLPDLKKQRQFIPIEPKFKKDYKEIMNRLLNPRRDEDGRPLDTYMGLAMTGRNILSQYKLDTAIDLAESMLDAEESVVIVTNFIESANKLKEHFKDKACEIRGGMSDKDKQKAIDDFQAKNKKVCILNMQAGGVGITLTASHNMIIMDFAWLPADMIQVEDRICRSGQTESCNIYYIYCENAILDTIFIDMISSKSANIDLVVDDSENTFDLNDAKSRASTYLDLLKLELKKLE